MKILVSIIRIITGLLFIFSGVVKGIDPRGLAYKMQEFFEAWANAGFMKSLMYSLNNYALQFSFFMIALEVAVGVALLLGWHKKLTLWILFLLMSFFTFLTAYVLYSGKIKACGCFGDCIPLTPIQTFTKDIILLLFTIILLWKQKYILPLMKPLVNTLLLLLGVLCIIFLQLYVLKHLPLTDCLPYKKGNNLLELRKMPANAIPDKFDYSFVYEKNGEKKNFDVAALPDSSWTFVDRKQVLVEKGSNNVPLINDFSFTNAAGENVTDTILSVPEKYYLLFMKEVPANEDNWTEKIKELVKKEPATKLYVITAQADNVRQFLTAHNLKVTDIFTTDGTAIKTAARANPVLFTMQGPVVKDKKSWADLESIK